MRVAAVVVVFVGCGGNTKDAPVDNKPAVVETRPAAADAAKPATTPSAALVTNTTDDAPALWRAIFGAAMPKLPAVSADGALLASYGGSGDMPMPVSPMTLDIYTIANGQQVELLPIVDMKDAEAASATEDWVKSKEAAPAIATMRERVAAVRARLAKGGFGSLVEVKFPMESSGALKPVKIAELTFQFEEAGIDDSPLVLSLVDASGAQVATERIESYRMGTWLEGDEPHDCSYLPTVTTAYTDAAQRMLYVQVRYRVHNLCPIARPYHRAMNLERARSVLAGRAAIAKLVTDQLAATTKTGVIASPHGATPPAIHGTPVIDLSRDGRAGWASVADKDWRASFVLANDGKGWAIDAAMWSQGVPDADANAKVKAKTLPALAPLIGAPGDAALREAFNHMTTQDLDNVAAVSPKLIAIGSAPNEQTSTGTVLASGWNTAWKGHLTITSMIALLAPSTTTGTVVATVSLAKPGGYSIPFMLFCVFDKQLDGTWSLVHIHFAV